jgi:two-component system phosphate regulon sensor histidine kinase PhoR
VSPSRWLGSRTGRLTGTLAALVLVAVAVLAWSGYRAAEEWQRSSASLVERRAAEMADTLVTAFNRDMRAVQTAILDGREWDSSSLESPYEVNDLIAGAFARYPYPELFFAWRASTPGILLFVRSDRMPAWLPAAVAHRDRYPVEIVVNPTIANDLLERVEGDVRARRKHSVFEIDIAGTRYQAVTRILYSGTTRVDSAGGLGFLVNLAWVRDHYFPAITSQVTRVVRSADGLDARITDEEAHPVPGHEQVAAEGLSVARSFPLFFFEPSLVALDPPEDLRRRMWSVQVTAGRDPTLASAAGGARRTLMVVAAGVFAVVLGLFVTVRAARAAADVAMMRSDFVSTVTHQLKTPVSVIRQIGETFIRGRVNTPERSREYAQLLVQEGHRLSRLIDNLLAYARVTEVAAVYSFEPHNPVEVIEESMKGFNRLLTEEGFHVDVDAQTPLPAVRADRTALVLALDNLVDNAMRYSGASRQLVVALRSRGDVVDFAVTDRGKGIPPDDLARVQQRFVRGRSTNGHGSGLGLAIVHRIATDHGGQLWLESRVGSGTTATLTIPVYRS